MSADVACMASPTPTMPSAESASPAAPVVIGLDDGYSDTKIALPDGRLIVAPSSARRGPSRKTWLANQKPTIREYLAEDATWSVGDVSAESTQFTEYPSSSLNRVIVQHALQEAGLSGRSIELTSGLPVSVFYDANGQRRTAAIDAKVASLKLSVVPKDDRAHATIGYNTVIPEALAAWYDFVITDAKDAAQMDEERLRGATAIVDIGGRTTDFVVVVDQAVDHARSGSIRCGALDLEQCVADELSDSFGLDEPTRAQLQSAVAQGVVRVFGEERPVGQRLKEAHRALLAKIRDECRRKLGSGAALDFVVFAGGGAVALASELANWFPQQTLAPSAGFANARGMLKYMLYVAEKPNLSVATAAQ